MTSAGDRINFWVLMIFLAVLGLFGGASRIDVAGQAVVQVVAVAAIALVLIQRVNELPSLRPISLLLAALAALMALQLVPLPPAFWTMLPGREVYQDTYRVVGEPLPWRPISIVPMLTLISLLGLLPLVAIVRLFSAVSPERRNWVLIALLAIAVLSAVLGLFQISSSGRGLYLYQIVNRGFPTGLFANRNHQGALLACAIPIMATFAINGVDGDQKGRGLRILAAAVGLMLFLPLVLVNGSRTGLALAAMAILGTLAMLLRGDAIGFSALKHWPRRRVAIVGVLTIIVLVLLPALVILSGRDAAFERLLRLDASGEQRFAVIEPLRLMILGHLPFGGGFGTFENVFKIYEPLSELRLEYLNHAHNDVLEFLYEGGLISLVLMLALLFYWVKLSIVAWLRRSGAGVQVVQARCGSLVTLLLAMGSVSDYPLRTPLLAALFVIGFCWMACVDGVPAIRRTR